MATQAIVSVTKENQVLIKIIAGSDGYNAKALAKAIKKIGESVFSLPLSEIYDLALRTDFGSPDDLVVMNAEELYYDEFSEDPSPLFRKTFFNAKFNPRWECGLADYIEVVSM